VSGKAGGAPEIGYIRGMAKSTRATVFLEKAGEAFQLHAYDYDPDVESIGLAAAEALGASAARVLKTLMVQVDGKPACVILPSDREVSMKRLAALLGGKSAAMMKPAEAEKITGYKIGGVSPFGRMRVTPVALEASATAFETVFVNGGQRGLQLELAPVVIIRLLGANVGDIAA
jgi:Cys-tRNA(Pro)/Cys-tRNA(Cys) deacylase